MQKKMSSSHAMARPCSLVYKIHTSATAFLWCKPMDSGNHANPASVHKQPSTKPTARTAFPPLNKPSNRYMQCASTWIKTIKAGNFHGWPLLSTTNALKYYPETAETPKGHLNQTRMNVCSTKPKHPFEELHSTKLHGHKERNIYTKVYNTRETIFTDQTGKFPTCSQDSHQYIMIMSRKDSRLTRAYTNLMLRLHCAGIQPRGHILDNEISHTMKDLIQDRYHLTYELAPPRSHRCNATEITISNFKSHFLSILAGIASNFPLQLWDKLLPQAKITLNLFCQSNATPTISAYAHLCGPFDYNKMPLAPLGCNV
eukprot:CCRYP_002170-RA/>CCRYP_002170-RA protein AED:0.36 eAED:0.36 QI:0/0/0/1/0/0/3/0/313